MSLADCLSQAPITSGAPQEIARFPQIEVLELKEEVIKFKLSDTDVSVANAIRRTMIAEVSCMAIDFVTIESNTSVLYDDFVAHRLGLIPIRVKKNLSAYKSSQDCMCTDHCPFCSVVFQLHVKCEERQMTVTTKHLVSKDPAVEPVCFASEQEKKGAEQANETGISIVQLSYGQELKLHCIAKMGTGREHAKWIPVAIATYQFIPVITLNQDVLEQLDENQKEALKDCCPRGVFEIQDGSNYEKELVVADSMMCVFCDECVELGTTMKNEMNGVDNVVAVSNVPENFIFTVESTGAMAPEEIVKSAIDVVLKKLRDLKNRCHELESGESEQAGGQGLAADLNQFGDVAAYNAGGGHY